MLEKNHKHNVMFHIRKKLFVSFLTISAGASLFSAAANTFNARPLSNILQPLIAGIICLAMSFAVRRDFCPRHLKYVFFVIFNVLYLPLVWLSSPGSFSAMGYYALMILVLTLLLAEKTTDYFFPLVTILEVIHFFFFEAAHIESLYQYSDLIYRAKDLSINFTLIAGILGYTVYTINQHFEDEHTRLYSQSVTDSLTGLTNRAHILSLLKTVIDREDDDSGFTLLMIDINNFKKINDIYGHLKGDEILKVFAKVLNETISPRSVCSRYGGDEFLVILMGYDHRFASKVISSIHAQYEIIANSCPEACSSLAIGVCTETKGTVDELIGAADRKMYENKNSDKAHLIVYNTVEKT